ncbi:zinc finger-containing ubiquitin peptidase 1-like isoform X1 [Scleropages formosus]|uniref:zinc finger-containing ubiquitin peptidase 1-like isoform X1 n=1 Tax=Scleropages formosus TaxID=113540 RepID=UPI0008791B7C|nr:zinc finger-containing ubiquitin peptidase 1 isoform X1 [Scleropages formosus]
MLTCEICGEEMLPEADMRTHLLLGHLEGELSCPMCPLAGVTYDDLQFHIDTAHSENEPSRPGKRCVEEESETQARASGGRSSAGASRSAGRRCPGGDAGEPTVKRGPLQSPFHTPENAHLQPLQEAEAGKLTLTSHKAMKGNLMPRKSDSTDETLVASPRKEFSCPMCALVCSDCFVLQEHVELHLDATQVKVKEDFESDLQLARQLQEEEDLRSRRQEAKREAEDFKKLQGQYGLDGRGGYRRQLETCMERAVSRGHMAPLEFHRKKAEVMECLASGVDDGKSRTSGLMAALYEYYLKNGQDIANVWLSAETDHYSSSEGDRGWGCGYRNFQMLLSSLQKMELYRDCLTDGTVPSIPRVQALIEEAWREGADPQGASHFKHRLQGTRAWIGATEIYSLLTSLRVRARIVDFDQPTGPGSTHPKLFEWVKTYFSASSSRGARLPPRVAKSSQPPIYLQHQGHSRTIVGIEQKKNGTLCLLVFDPGCPLEDMRRLLTPGLGASSVRLFRKFPSQLKHKQYQVVSAEGVLSPEEKQVSSWSLLLSFRQSGNNFMCPYCIVSIVRCFGEKRLQSK